jgi:hypothetical protein
MYIGKSSISVSVCSFLAQWFNNSQRQHKLLAWILGHGGVLRLHNSASSGGVIATGFKPVK